MVFVDGNSGSIQVHQLQQQSPPKNSCTQILRFPIKDQSIPEDSIMNNQHYQQSYQGHQNKNDDRTNLIINYLPQSMTEKELYSMFVTIGPVESCRVMKDYKVSHSHCFKKKS